MRHKVGVRQDPGHLFLAWSTEGSSENVLKLVHHTDLGSSGSPEFRIIAFMALFD